MFDARYEVVVADTPDTLRIHHELRYAVYCLERGFEDPGAFPDGQERDAWDVNATAFIVRERDTGQWVGTTRLVHAMQGDLPVHRLTRLSQVGTLAHPGAATELSRICITGDYQRHRLPAHASQDDPCWEGRKAQVDGRTVIGGWRTQQRGPLFRSMQADDGECLNRQGMNAMIGPVGLPEARSCAPTGPMRSELFAGMLRAAIEYSRHQDIPYMYFLVNRALARMVSRLGFEFSLAGVPCEHRGVRYPYLAHVETAVQRAVESSPDMARLFLSAAAPYRYASEVTHHSPEWH
ncbi:GNAT family N-acyltransferase [Ectothiorhodospira marina]|uniref:N-acyl amino acid synthase, PEP-CTERM/exosortase system-associated n=1 Tax=Ectothiorhodospira marina TaxID=1396821 RepID=A0A1H7IKV4_9GAMM|nr:GNAT family N-acyltransferase [Ectothiorhodospira marina]SEK63099.1 N-acyl amino acid synthase, PEP-CTERM/exosortase system-associated [Ectothiorhodospira marina]